MPVLMFVRGRVYAGNETGKNDKRRRETMMGVEHLRITSRGNPSRRWAWNDVIFFFGGRGRDEDEGKGNGGDT